MSPASDPVGTAAAALPADIQALIDEGQKLVRSGQPLLARPVLEALHDAVRRCGHEHSQALIEPLIQAAMTASICADFQTSRETIRLCYTLVARLKQSARARARHAVQAAHIRWCLESEDLTAAVMLCGEALGLRSVGGRRNDELVWYCIEAATVLRRLGLHGLTLQLLDELDARIHGYADVCASEMRVAIALCRSHVLANQSGLSFRKQGPLGWEPCDPAQARAKLVDSLKALEEASAAAEAAGGLGYARTGRQMCRAYAPDFASQPAELLAFVTELARSTKALGFKSKEQGLLIDLAGLQVDNGLYGQAMASLQQAAAISPIGIGPIAVAERWHWFRYCCLREQGPVDQATAAYADYARAVDARTALSRAFLLGRVLQGQPSGAAEGRRMASTAARRNDPMKASCDEPGDSGELRERLASLTRTANSPAELAVGLGVSVRRMQQLFKVWGLPSPARYLRAQRATR